MNIFTEIAYMNIKKTEKACCCDGR